MARSQCGATTESGDKCGAETADGSPCEIRGRCPHHGSDEATHDSDDGSDLGIPTEESFYEEHSSLVLSLRGADEPWSGHDAKDTAAKMSIRSIEGGQAAYKAVFGPCEVCGESGANGFEAQTCSDCEREAETDDETGADDDAGEMTVTIDGKTVTGSKETIQALLDQ